MVRIALVCLGLPLGALAQSPPLQFEVTSIRLHEGPAPRINLSTAGNTLSAEAYPLFELVSYAYGLRDYQVAFAHPTRILLYDITAKAPGGTAPTQDQFRQMLQALLADRFQMKVHRETRETEVYALVVSKNGPKLRTAGGNPGAVARTTVSGRNQTFTSAKASIDQIVSGIQNASPGRIVVDQTGLTGNYEVSLTYTPEFRIRSLPEPDPNDISIFTAVQEQLGLKLDPRKEPVEFLVVDSVEKPSDN